MPKTNRTVATSGDIFAMIEERAVLRCLAQPMADGLAACVSARFPVQIAAMTTFRFDRGTFWRSRFLWRRSSSALPPRPATEAGWALLREGGHVVLIRHACRRDRRPAGRRHRELRHPAHPLRPRQAAGRPHGALFAARAAPVDSVLSSRYCRCLDTARFAFGEREPERGARPPAGRPAARKAEQLTTVVGRIPPSPAPATWCSSPIGEHRGADRRAPREGEALIVEPTGRQAARARPHHLRRRRRCPQAPSRNCCRNATAEEATIFRHDNAACDSLTQAAIGALPVTEARVSATAGAFVSARAGGAASAVYGAAVEGGTRM